MSFHLLLPLQDQVVPLLLTRCFLLSLGISEKSNGKKSPFPGLGSTGEVDISIYIFNMEQQQNSFK